MNDTIKEELEKLKKASPLESTKILQKIELYDSKSSQEIIDEIYEQFESGENLKDEVLKPVFSSVIDGILVNTSMGKGMRKKGITASRILAECESFSYEENDNKIPVRGDDEYRNAEMDRQKYGEETRPDFDRSKYEDKSKMDDYKKRKIEENEGKKNIRDEYTDQRNITANRNDPDKRRNDEKNSHQAETDHIIPLKQIHAEYKGNFALTDDDIKRIANSDSNLALTSSEINRKKGADSNSDYINKNQNTDDNTRRIMTEKEKRAKEDLEKDVNHIVFKNLIGKGVPDKEEIKKAYIEQEKKLGRSLTQDEKNSINHNLSKDKQKTIMKTDAKMALNQASENAVGNIILYILKPLYFEIKDIFKNGMSEGVNAQSGLEAIKIRFDRIKTHLVENSSEFLGGSVKEFILGFASSLIEGIIGVFVGIFKQILKLVKEGIKIFTESVKVLFGEESKKMSASQKGDAIIKIIGGSVIAISGIGIEFLLNKIGIGEPWSIIISTMLSGISSAIFMYVLNKIDIFSVKAEKRRNRIIEIFDERINDVNEAAEACDLITIEMLKKQREEFDLSLNKINAGIKSNEVNSINSGLNEVAKFMNVDLEYSNNDEFCDFWDSEEELSF